MPNSVKTVLCIEDDSLILMTLGYILQSCGFKVLTASNGKDALNIFLGELDTVSVIVSDYLMPEMNGIQFAQEAKKVSPHTPVVIITGCVEEISDASVDKVIKKPIKPEELIEVINTFLRSPIKTRKNHGDPNTPKPTRVT